MNTLKKAALLFISLTTISFANDSKVTNGWKFRKECDGFLRTSEISKMRDEILELSRKNFLANTHVQNLKEWNQLSRLKKTVLIDHLKNRKALFVDPLDSNTQKAIEKMLLILDSKVVFVEDGTEIEKPTDVFLKKEVLKAKDGAPLGVRLQLSKIIYSTTGETFGVSVVGIFDIDGTLLEVAAF
jgi:hypothetical protein